MVFPPARSVGVSLPVLAEMGEQPHPVDTVLGAGTWSPFLRVSPESPAELGLGL